MDIASQDISSVAPLGHDEAIDLQAVEIQRAIDLLAGLTPEQWSMQTECPAWDVRRMYLHVLGACESAASWREQAHQMRVAFGDRRRSGGPLEAALSGVQVREREELSPTELVERLRAVAPRTVSRRRSLPGFVRNTARMKVDGPVEETWRLGYLVDTIYLRDLWLHRIDACRAVGQEPQLDAAHDGRIVADVVAEWARRHGRPFRLVLDGPAGGAFHSGPAPADGEEIRLDAVEMCRTVGGRVPGEGLLATIVPF